MATIKERLKVIRAMEEANIKSIDRYLKRKDDASISAIIRREYIVNTEMKKIVSEFEQGVEE